MKESFINRVIKNGIVDTYEYRYVYEEYGAWAIIKRIKLSMLDTTAALEEDNWKIMKEWGVKL